MYIRKRAANETRTRDPDLGKVVLYQLSYCRINSGCKGKPKYRNGQTFYSFYIFALSPRWFRGVWEPVSGGPQAPQGGVQYPMEGMESHSGIAGIIAPFAETAFLLFRILFTFLLFYFSLAAVTIKRRAGRYLYIY